MPQPVQEIELIFSFPEKFSIRFLVLMETMVMVSSFLVESWKLLSYKGLRDSKRQNFPGEATQLKSND